MKNLIKDKFPRRIYWMVLTAMVGLGLVYACVSYREQNAALRRDFIRSGWVLARMFADGTRIGVYSEVPDILRSSFETVLDQRDVLEAGVYTLDGAVIRRTAGTRFPIEISGDTEQTAYMKKVVAQLKLTEQEDFFEFWGKIEFWTPIISYNVLFDEYMTYADGTSPLVNRMIGYASVSLSKKHYWQRKAAALAKALSLGGVVTLFGGLFGYLAVGLGTCRFTRLLSEVKKLEEGRVEAVLVDGRDDDVGRLGKAVNTLAQAVRVRDEALKKHNIVLEGDSVEKTEVIEEAVERIEEQIVEMDDTELELDDNGKRYFDILSNIEEGYFETDLDGSIAFLNEAFSRMTGYSPEELFSMEESDLALKESRKRSAAVAKQVFETGDPGLISDYEVITADEKRLYLDVSVALMRDEVEGVRGFRGIARDVTRRHGEQLEQRSIAEHKHRIKRLESIATLAGGVAHDFNNLLMGIQGHAGLMALRLEGDDLHQKSLKNIERCVDRGARLTNELLGFARGGKYKVDRLDVNSLINEMIPRYFNSGAKAPEIVPACSEDLCGIEGDMGQVEQVILNIVKNGAEATSFRRPVRVETKNVVLGKREMLRYSVQPGRYVQIMITDQGCGMDEETKNRIFEPFFTTKGMGGTGLGMASAYGIVKNHGGFIDLESEVGEGTKVYVWLPAAEKKSETKAPEASLPEAPDTRKIEGGDAEKITLLLVDDEQTIIDVAGDMLELMGFSVIVAEGGEEAVRIYEERGEEISLVILDMIMPDLGGVDVFHILQKNDPAVRTILSSGYSLGDQAKELMSKGCRGFIQKPYTMAQLSDVVRSALA